MGSHPERLLALLGPGEHRAAVIANACDGYPVADRPGAGQREIVALRELGIAAVELDLRDYFVDRDALLLALSRIEMVWVRGGSVFVLRHALAASGADQILRERVQRGDVVWSGPATAPEAVSSPRASAVSRSSTHRTSSRRYMVPRRGGTAWG